jgi:4-amino-4-deoxy-L-arabinose transferase-like glycosyltransferase
VLLLASRWQPRAVGLPRLRRIGERQFHWLSYALFAGLLLVILGTFLDYGLAWDEEEHRLYGDFVFQWYATLFQDRYALSYWVLYLYGAFFEIVARAAAPILPFGLYEGRHLVSALFGLLGIVVAYKTAGHLGGPIAGFFAALFLTLTPGFYGHLFVNPKDVPFATLSLLSLYCFFLTYDALPRVPLRLLLWTGLAVGCALGIRVGGILLLGYLAVLWAGWLILRYRVGLDSTRGSVAGVVRRLVVSFLLIALVAWAVMLLCWPWAQVDPLLNPIRGILATANFVAWYGEVFFDGRYYRATDMPASYLPTWFAISLPEFYVVALLVGCLLAWRWVAELGRDCRRLVPALQIGVLAMSVVVPVVAAIGLRSVVYDGVRQFLFVVPPLAVLAGVAVAGLFRAPAGRHLKLGVGLAIALSVGVTVLDMVRLHPYQYVYFNRLVTGGVDAGARRFETDYWGLSYREGIEWLIENYRPRSPGRVRVANCSRAYLTDYYLQKSPEARQRFETVEPGAQPDVFLATTRFGCHDLVPGRRLHVVERLGVPLLYVIEVRR